MAPGGHGHTGEGAGEGREDGGRPQGDGNLEKCAELRLDTLEKRRQDQDMALVHKFVTQPSPAGQAMFNIQHGARTRQAAGGHGLAV